MKRLNFSVDINASREEVWNALWNDVTYRQWTSAFSEGSHAVSGWNEGGKILFLDPNGDGMYSRIEKKIPNEFMSFKHLGTVKGGKEMPLDEETKKWSGAMENYTLRQTGNITRVTVDVDVTEEHYDIFNEAFPKAFQKLKEISEKSKATAIVS